MWIRLQNFSGDKRVVDKTSLLSLWYVDISGNMRFPLDILRPTIDIDLSAIDDATEKAHAEVANYCYISTLDRYYFIVGKTYINDKIISLSMVEDVLFTWALEIKSLSEIVDRSQSAYNALLEDTLLPLDIKKDVTEFAPTKITDEGITYTTFKASNFSNTEFNISVTTCSDAGSIATINAPDSSLPTIANDYFAGAGGSVVYAMQPTNLASVIVDLQSDYSAYETFFKSAVAFPFDLSEKSGGTAVAVTLFMYDAQTQTWSTATLGNQNAYYIQNTSDYRILTYFKMPSALWFYYYAPYSRYEIYLPFYGWKELDYTSIAGHKIMVYYSVNYEDGSGQVYVYDNTDKKQIFNAPCQVGVRLSISSTNAQELGTKKQAMENSLILSSIGSAVGLIGSVASGNVLGAVGSGLNLIKGVTDYNNTLSQMFIHAQSTNNGASGGLYNPLEVRVRITRPKIRGNLTYSDFIKTYGGTCGEQKTLSTLTGMTIISRPVLSGMGASLESEKEEIRKLMQTGIIL